jgi:hypothetical protein
MDLKTALKQGRIWKREVEVMSRKGMPKRSGDLEEMSAILSEVEGYCSTEGICSETAKPSEKKIAVYEYILGGSNIRLE